MNKYSKLIKFGRDLKAKKKFTPEEVIGIIDHLEKEFMWEPITDFFSVFPPTKTQSFDNWDYESSLNYIETTYGERMGKGAFIDIITNHMYDNPYLQKVGIHFFKAINRLNIDYAGESIWDYYSRAKRITNGEEV